jgi:hypothetical protein
MFSFCFGRRWVGVSCGLMNFWVEPMCVNVGFAPVLGSLSQSCMCVSCAKVGILLMISIVWTRHCLAVYEWAP